MIPNSEPGTTRPIRDRPLHRGTSDPAPIQAQAKRGGSGQTKKVKSDADAGVDYSKVGLDTTTSKRSSIHR